MGISSIIFFVLYLLAVTFFGVLACRLTKNLSDFVLGGRTLAGPIAALSSGASDMSAWLLMGLPGAVYLLGMSQIWLPIGLVIGAYLNWKIIAKPLRTYTEIANDSLTVPAFLDNRFLCQAKYIRAISAIATIIFFAFYSASGLLAGAKLISLSFGLDYYTALLIGTTIIMIYTFVGGFLAVSWTDFFQGNFMLICMLVVPYLVINQVGSVSQVITVVNANMPYYFDVFNGQSFIGVASLLAWGLGYFGQPHILVRFMSVKTEKEIPIARIICMSWMILSLAGAFLIGIIGKAYYLSGLAPKNLSEAQLIFVEFSHILFAPWLTGIVLAAIISAIMCAVDSQMLASSSAIVEDVYHKFISKNATQKELIFVGRIAVIAMACVAVIIALEQNKLVIDIVEFAWAGLGATFGPAVIGALFWRRMTGLGATLGMSVGVISVIGWKILSYKYAICDEVYEIIPGFILSFITIIVVSKIDKPPAKEIVEQFDRVKELIKLR